MTVLDLKKWVLMFTLMAKWDPPLHQFIYCCTQYKFFFSTRSSLILIDNLARPPGLITELSFLFVVVCPESSGVFFFQAQYSYGFSARIPL